MLPTHVFADVVGCLPLYDLDALLLTDARCSDVAQLAASEIRVFDFSQFQFDVYNNDIVVSKMADGKALDEVITLEFLDDADLADFIPDFIHFIQKLYSRQPGHDPQWLFRCDEQGGPDGRHQRHAGALRIYVCERTFSGGTRRQIQKRQGTFLIF